MTIKNVESNMTVISSYGYVVLFSYQTPVAAGIPNNRWFRTEKTWSVTTTRHVNKWLSGMYAELKPQSFFDSLLTVNVNGVKS